MASVHAPTAAALGIATTLAELRSAPGADPVPQAGIRTSNLVALTFDDGPHPVGTPAILEILDQHGAKATFFVVGEQVVRRPELVAETLRRGHAIALHGYRHRLQSRLSALTLRDDLLRGSAAIADAIGQAPKLHRPPYGIYSPEGLRIARELGLEPLLWARWGKDWRRLTTPARIARRSLRGVAAGDVILLHDADYYSARSSHLRTAAALKLILRELEARGVDTVLAV
jgi:peptidoglycan-N-acetylglucosamine deacetylase